MRIQFGIKTLLILMFCICVVIGVLVQGGPFVQSIMVSVLLANFVGVVLALFVTFVMRIPRDGSLRNGGSEETDETSNCQPPVK